MCRSAEVVLGHAELGCRTVDVFSMFRCRVSACLLHGRLLLLGAENGTLAVYFVPSERSLPDLDLFNPAGRLKLGCDPLRRLFMVDQAETVRVLALDSAGRLHQCYWRRPRAGYLPSQEIAGYLPSQEMAEYGVRYMVFSTDQASVWWLGGR